MYIDLYDSIYGKFLNTGPDLHDETEMSLEIHLYYNLETQFNNIGIQNSL